MHPRPWGRLALLAALFMASLYAAAPTLGLAGLFRPLMSEEGYRRYAADTVTLGLDLAGGLDVVYRVESDRPEDVERAADVLRARVEGIGRGGIRVQVQEGRQIGLQLPVRDLEAQRRLEKTLATTRLLSFHRVRDAALVAPTLFDTTRERVVPASRGEDARAPRVWFLLEREPALTGERVAEARIGFDALTGEPRVHLRLDPEGARAFLDLTRELTGERLAIVMADEVVMAPVIEGPIPGGSAEIRGSFDLETARLVTRALRAGALPADLTRLASSRVGPSLGPDAISRSVKAAAGGMGLVAAFMVARYGTAGAFAVGALGMNLTLILTGMRALDATLTLPGIAGLVLGTGMAVDANVLAFERLQEERRQGATEAQALSRGFARAGPAILDSNLTTLLTAGALYAFGGGPVRGFAVTLALGIGCNLFTAVHGVRTVMEACLPVTTGARRRGRAA